MIDVTLCADATQGAQTTYGSLNPDAVALMEMLDPHAIDYRRTLVRVTLTFGREIVVALQGGQLTSDRDEHLRRYQEFSRKLLQAKSPLAAMSIES